MSSTAPPSAPGAPSTPRAPRRRRVARVAQLALITGTAFFLGAYLVRSWDAVRGYEWAWRPGWLALSAFALLAFYAMQALAWWLLLRGFGVHSPLPQAVSTWARSILARYLPGNVFMFVGRAWMSHSQGLPVDRVSAAMVYEQVLGVCSALVAVAILFPFWEYGRDATALSLLAVPILIALLHPRVFGPLADRVLRALRRQPLGAELRFAAALGMLWYYVAAWLPAGLGAWLLARATIGLEASALPAMVAAYALAYVVGMAAFVFPSGIGVREAVLTAALARRLPGGVALAWALLLRLWVTLVELVFVGLAVAAGAAARRWGKRG